MSNSPSSVSEPNWSKVETSSHYTLIGALTLLALLHGQQLTPQLKMVLSWSIVLLLLYGLTVSSWAKLMMKKDHEKGGVSEWETVLYVVSALGGILVAVAAWFIVAKSNEDIPLIKNNSWGVLLGLALWMLPLIIDTYAY